MRLGSIKGLAAATVAGTLLIPGLGANPSLGGDEPRGLGRLFRMGGGNSTPTPAPLFPSTPTREPSTPFGQPALSTPPSSLPGSSTGPKVTPKPRVNRAATEADPLVTRVSLGRSDDGTQFAMFLQVYADGTVIDNTGVHKVGGDALKPVVEAVASGDIAKVKGHCGGPAGDFIESNYVVVYDRAYGRLRANSFSYAGTTQGCDHAVHHLQTVLEALQAKISGTAPAVVAPASAPSGLPAAGIPVSAPIPLTTLP